MRILILHKWLVMGGIEKILINYLKLLSNEKEIKIDLILAYDHSDSPFKKEIPKNITTIFLFNNENTKRINFLYKNRNKNIISKFRYKIVRIKEKFDYRNRINSIIKNKYDIIINFSNHFDQYLPFNKIQSPTIRWQHLALKEDKSKEVIKEISYLRKYDYVIAICEDMAKSLSLRSGLKDNILTLYNPIGEDEVILKSKQPILTHLKNPYFIQVARLDKIKRHEDLINIYSKLVKLGIEENLYILGDGEEKENLSKLIKKLNLENRCLLLGEIKNPYPYIKNAKLFLHTSEREGLPTVLLESLFLNVPVIAIDCPTGPREILNNGKCGGLIPLNNFDLFISKTYEISSSKELLEKIRGEIKEHIHIFSENRTRENLIKFLYSLI